MKKKATKEPIKNEVSSNLENGHGTIAMARTKIIDSVTSQFFINHNKDNDFLNQRNNTAGGFGYAVFSKVIEGMDVVDISNRPGYIHLPGWC